MGRDGISLSPSGFETDRLMAETAITGVPGYGSLCASNILVIFWCICDRLLSSMLYFVQPNGLFGGLCGRPLRWLKYGGLKAQHTVLRHHNVHTACKISPESQCPLLHCCSSCWMIETGSKHRWHCDTLPHGFSHKISQAAAVRTANSAATVFRGAVPSNCIGPLRVPFPPVEFIPGPNVCRLIARNVRLQSWRMLLSVGTKVPSGVAW